LLNVKLEKKIIYTKETVKITVKDVREF